MRPWIGAARFLITFGFVVFKIIFRGQKKSISNELGLNQQNQDSTQQLIDSNSDVAADRAPSSPSQSPASRSRPKNSSGFSWYKFRVYGGMALAVGNFVIPTMQAVISPIQEVNRRCESPYRDEFSTLVTVYNLSLLVIVSVAAFSQARRVLIAAMFIPLQFVQTSTEVNIRQIIVFDFLHDISTLQCFHLILQDYPDRSDIRIILSQPVGIMVSLFVSSGLILFSPLITALRTTRETALAVIEVQALTDAFRTRGQTVVQPKTGGAASHNAGQSRVRLGNNGAHRASTANQPSLSLPAIPEGTAGLENLSTDDSSSASAARYATNVGAAAVVADVQSVDSRSATLTALRERSLTVLRERAKFFAVAASIQSANQNRLAAGGGLDSFSDESKSDSNSSQNPHASVIRAALDPQELRRASIWFDDSILDAPDVDVDELARQQQQERFAAATSSSFVPSPPSSLIAPSAVSHPSIELTDMSQDSHLPSHQTISPPISFQFSQTDVALNAPSPYVNSSSTDNAISTYSSPFSSSSLSSSSPSHFQQSVSSSLFASSSGASDESKSI